MRRVRIQSAVLLLLALLAAALWLSAWQAAPGNLVVTFLDVGQGDCIIVRSPTGRALLIDGGGASAYGGTSDTARRIILPALLVSGVTRLDAVILTHPHEDHIGGLAEVIERVPTGILLARLDEEGENAPACRDLLDAARHRGTRVVAATRGQVLRLGSGVAGEILHPGPEQVAGSSSDVNNNSVVLRLTYGQVTVVLPGDLEEEGEQWVLTRHPDVAGTVLKVAHHGSGSATSDVWLDAVRPRVAVISVGRRNSFGLPDASALARLRARGVRVLRTDLDGAVTVATDGQSLDIHTHKDR